MFLLLSCNRHFPLFSVWNPPLSFGRERSMRERKGISTLEKRHNTLMILIYIIRLGHSLASSFLQRLCLCVSTWRTSVCSWCSLFIQIATEFSSLSRWHVTWKSSAGRRPRRCLSIDLCGGQWHMSVRSCAAAPRWKPAVRSTFYNLCINSTLNQLFNTIPNILSFHELLRYMYCSHHPSLSIYRKPHDLHYVFK